MSLEAMSFEQGLKGRVVLIVENEPSERLKYQGYASSMGMASLAAENPKEAERLIEELMIDFAYCDLHLTTEAGQEIPDGLGVIRHLRETHPQCVIVAMSSDPRRDLGDLALKAGAKHFARKPFVTIEDFKIALRLASQRFALESNQLPSKASALQSRYPDGIVIGSELRAVITKLAKRPDIGINLTGETGTGKEEIVKLYHRFRTIHEGPIPFVAVNCARLTHSLADSELFGHKKGAFTGANENSVGYVGAAHGGILFLDEIQALEPAVQAKLLRVLNDGSYTCVGDTKPRFSKFQLITATTRDLEQECLACRFSMDLKMRIDGYPIVLPPLRERKQDIPDLFRLAMSLNDQSMSERQIETMSRFLQKFYWPGNIRQFMKVIKAWVLHCDIYDLPLDIKNLPVSLTMDAPSDAPKPVEPVNMAPEAPGKLQDVREMLDQALIKDHNIDSVMAEIEKALLLKAMDRHKTITAACIGLGLARSTFDARRRKLNML